MGIVVIGAVFVDIKGYPLSAYIPGGRNAGRIEQVHGGVIPSEKKWQNSSESPAMMQRSFRWQQEQQAIHRNLLKRMRRS